MPTQIRSGSVDRQICGHVNFICFLVGLIIVRPARKLTWASLFVLSGSRLLKSATFKDFANCRKFQCPSLFASCVSFLLYFGCYRLDSKEPGFLTCFQAASFVYLDEPREFVSC